MRTQAQSAVQCKRADYEVANSAATRQIRVRLDSFRMQEEKKRNVKECANKLAIGISFVLYFKVQRLGCNKKVLCIL